ncbi:MAG: cell wall hydrolase [Allosphingosinicella sp.]
MLKALTIDAIADLGRWRGREIACASMLLLSASCVPLRAASAPESPAPDRQATETTTRDIVAEAPLPPEALAEAEAAAPAPAPAGSEAAVNASIPVSTAPNPRAASVVFRARSPLDQQRALQCLAEAVYYEARSESEDGQRAVAQVVLNRVRHPSYPSSVCGVVYQGPLRAGGGCQFTFTCDGSLAVAPSGAGWAQARRIAAAALAGSVYAPVGHATHYHTHQVVPFWAWKLVKNAVVGAHNFYRMEGAWGTPAVFAKGYAGREPAPGAVMAVRLPVAPVALPQTVTHAPAQPLAYAVPVLAAPAAPAAAPESAADDSLPPSTIREEYRNSGRWKVPPPAPAAIP